MKQFLYLLLAIAILFTTESCKKDPCKDTVCLNGGACDDGTCICPTGYSGPQCQTFDPCAGINCLNGGTCISGACQCPAGYSGADCSVLLTPVQVRVNSIVINSYPMTNSSGGGWDGLAGNGPDIFVSVNPGQSSNTTTWVSSTNNNLTGGSFTINTNITFGSPNTYYTIGLWDEDTLGDEFMSGVYFIPNNYATSRPSTITLNTASMQAVLYVTWLF